MTDYVAIMNDQFATPYEDYLSLQGLHPVDMTLVNAMSVDAGTNVDMTYEIPPVLTGVLSILSLFFAVQLLMNVPKSKWWTEKGRPLMLLAMVFLVYAVSLLSALVFHFTSFPAATIAALILVYLMAWLTFTNQAALVARILGDVRSD